MKKILLIVSVFILSINGNSQVKIGIKGGLTISNQVNPYIYSYSIKPHYDRGQSVSAPNAAMFAEFNLNKKILVRVQVALLNEGYKLPEAYDSLIGKTSPTQKFRMNYISLPVQLIYNIPVKPGHVWIGAGPYYSFLIDARVEVNNNKIRLTGNTSQQHFKSANFGFSPTVGLSLNSGLLIGMDYNLGLADVSTSSEKSRNTSWSFFIGYTFKNHK